MVKAGRTLIAATMVIAFTTHVQSEESSEEYSIFYGPLESRSEALEQVKYIKNVYQYPIFMTKLDGKYFLLMGIYRDPLQGQSDLYQLRETGLLNLRLRERYAAGSVGKQVAGEPINIGQILEQTQVKPESPIFIDQESDMVDSMYQETDSDLLNRAWSELGFENYPLACSLFEQASFDESLKLQAFDGWAECLTQLSKFQLAAEKLKYLVSRQYRLLSVYQRLIYLLKKVGDESLSEYYQGELTLYEQSLGIDKRRETELRIAVAKSIEEEDKETTISLIDGSNKYLRECRAVDVYMSASDFYERKDLDGRAAQMYLKLLEYCPQKWSLRVALYQRLSNLISVAELETRIQEEQNALSLSSVYNQKLNTLLANTYGRVFYSKNNSDPEKETIGLKILKLSPKSWTVLSILAWNAYHVKNHPLSLDRFNQLLRVYPKRREYAQGVFLNLMAVGKTIEATDTAKKHGLNEEWILGLETQLSNAEGDKKVELAELLLKVKPQHLWSMQILAWHYLNTKQAHKSLSLFFKLLESSPQDESAIQGLMLSAHQSKNWDVIHDNMQSTLLTSEQQTYWQNQWHNYKANEAFQQDQYAIARDHFLMIQPQTSDQWEMLGWCEHRLGQHKAALVYFENAYSVSPSSGLAEARLLMLQALKKNAELNRLALNFSKHKDEAYRQVGLKFLTSALPQVAAQQSKTASDDISPLKQNWNKANVEFHQRFSEQNGDPGKTQLLRRIQSLWLNSPWIHGWHLSLAWHQENLQAGKTQSADVGSDYQNNIITSNWNQRYWNLNTPQVRLHHLGSQYQIHSILGKSPSGGPLKPATAARFSVRTDTTQVDLFRIPRTDSQLAYIGLRDPYDSSPWGRVLDTGVSYSRDWGLTESFWLNANASVTQQGGTGVSENHHRDVGLSIGRTQSLWRHQMTLGLYSVFQTNDHDSDFYTSGHGGFYSPDQSATSGILANIESQNRENKWWRVDASASGYWVKTEDTEKYSDTTRSEIYNGSKTQGLSYRLAAQGYYLIWNHLKLYAQGEWNRAGGYLFYQGMVGVQWFWSGRQSVGPPLPPMSIWSPRWPEQ